jgi:tRNA modification GTPase
MFDLNDTIAAISSRASSDAVRSIIRISGPSAFEMVKSIFAGPLVTPGLSSGFVQVDTDLSLRAKVYSYVSPHSYTGQDLVEIHLLANSIAAQALLQKILSCSARLAGPGEFTARAYLNGKMDLAQAEAVSAIISSSTNLQLAAAGRLFAGRLKETLDSARAQLLDLLSLIEAGLDFSTENIEFISSSQACTRVKAIEYQLSQMLELTVACQETLALAPVGIAGLSNAGKSSLLNSLLGSSRMIVSDTPATTRDVVTEVLRLEHCSCAVFDCAGFLARESGNVLDQLGKSASVNALSSARLVLFCVDLAKNDFSDDKAIFESIRPADFLLVATKSDLAGDPELKRKTGILKAAFGIEPVVTSSSQKQGLELLKKEIDSKLVISSSNSEAADAIGLNQRQRTWISEAVSNLALARQELESDNHELASMLLRNAYRTFGEIWPEAIDEAVLERIFSKFCIGK